MDYFLDASINHLFHRQNPGWRLKCRRHYCSGGVGVSTHDSLDVWVSHGQRSPHPTDKGSLCLWLLSISTGEQLGIYMRFFEIMNMGLQKKDIPQKCCSFSRPECLDVTTITDVFEKQIACIQSFRLLLGIITNRILPGTNQRGSFRSLNAAYLQFTMVPSRP